MAENAATDELVAGGTYFTRAEFERRYAGIRAGMRELGLDALIVSAPKHVVYVVGNPTALELGLQPVIFTADRAVFITRKMEVAGVSLGTPLDDVVGYSGDVEDPEDPVEVLASHLSDLGVGQGRIGYEGDQWGLTPADLFGLQSRLGAEFVEATRIVMDLATVKSSEELALMRRVSKISVKGIEAFIAGCVEGRKENDIAADILEALMRGGSDYPGEIPCVLSGSRSWIPHVGWSPDKVLTRGDSVFSEQSAQLAHYHAPLTRTVLLGDNAEVERTYELARTAQDAAIATIRPGATTGEVDFACRGQLARAGKAHWLAHRVGYGVGIDWTFPARKALSMHPGGEEVLEAGMTFHIVTLLAHRDEYGIFISDTVAVTDDGAEILSGFPRDLVRK